MMIVKPPKPVYKPKGKIDACQVEALRRALKREKYGIFFEQRLGKTRVAIDFCGIKQISRGIKNVLIVCPLSVVFNWEDQIKEYYPTKAYYVSHYPQNPEKRDAFLQGVSINNVVNPGIINFIIVNYDKLALCRGNKYVEVKRLLHAINIDVIILDESHFIRNVSTRRYKALKELVPSVPMRLLLTGTPIAKNFYDIYGQFSIMNYNAFGMKWAEFKRRFCIMGGFEGREIVGCSQPEMLATIMEENSIRVLRKDVIEEPAVEDVVIPVQFERLAQTTYDSIKKQFLAEFKSGATITADLAIKRILRLHQCCGGWVTDDAGQLISISQAKLKTAIDLVDIHADANEPVVIFHKFTPEGEALCTSLRNKGLRVEALNGSVVPAKRKAAIVAFQAGGLDAIVIQISTGALGIKLDRSHINLFYSMDFSLSNYLQAKDRVMGRGQKHDVTNYFLCVKGSVDHKIINTLRKNKDMAEAIADNYAWAIE